ncbi:hypothetical protein [Yinghuangia sp. YIM S10712]|uniref:hypothetical protein n=1 Tax=Yinghuangia sp. YIM S10712 TaxID=3436930 RepID=UPI003F5389AA
MDDVRLTPAERRALDGIEGELRKDRDLDRAMRRMRLPGTRRRPLRGRVDSIDNVDGLESIDGDSTVAELSAADGDEAAPGPDTARGTGMDAHAPADSSADPPLGEPSGRRRRGHARRRRQDPHGDRRRVWMLTVVLCVVLAALFTAGTPFFLLFSMVVVTLAATAGVVWIFVALSMRRPDTG